MALVLVLGSGDVGSAVAHALFRAGHRPVLHDGARPSHARRGMAFTDAFFDGRCELEGVVAKRSRDAAGLLKMIACGHAVPASDAKFRDVLGDLRPDVLVDARIRKHDAPEPLAGLAPLTVGLGPGFTAGVHADVVVETAWGDELGRVIRMGRAADLTGEPRAIAGHGRDRCVYTDTSGIFETGRAIGDKVEAGEPVASIGSTVVEAPLSGVLRGLTHSGAEVGRGAKVLEVDPRGDRNAVFGIGERPARIARGVLEALG